MPDLDLIIGATMAAGSAVWLAYAVIREALA